MAAIHDSLTQLYEHARALQPCSIDVSLRLVDKYNLDVSSLSRSAQEQVHGYVSSLAWMGSPPVPPPSLSDDCPLLGANVPRVYGLYYEAMRAYLLARQKYSDYRLWIKSFVFGPQLLVPTVDPLSEPLNEEDPVVTLVREQIEGYLDYLAGALLCVWDAKPPLPPPTIAEMLMGAV
jgi:hypothetical protein